MGEGEAAPPSLSGLDKFEAFLQDADEQVAALGEELRVLTGKFAGVVQYFGEDPEMSSDTLFSTLLRFSVVFKSTTDKYLLQLQSEAAKTRREEGQAARRASMLPTKGAPDDKDKGCSSSDPSRDRSLSGLARVQGDKENAKQANRRKSIM